MARLARVVVPGTPHHIIQRGNRRMETFFSEKDYRQYLVFMSEWCQRCKIQIWSYCLMPNHIHLIAVPKSEDGLRRGIGEAHRRYSRHINSRKDWKGHLWQGRFASYPMDERYLIATARYIEINPVQAGITKTAEAYMWSSAKAHLYGKDDILVKTSPLLALIPDWKQFLSGDLSQEEHEAIRKHERTGRPLGTHTFISQLEQKIDRVLFKQKTGPKKK